jgi:hypothetical protein
MPETDNINDNNIFNLASRQRGCLLSAVAAVQTMTFKSQPAAVMVDLFSVHKQ